MPYAARLPSSFSADFSHFSIALRPTQVQRASPSCSRSYHTVCLSTAIASTHCAPHPRSRNESPPRSLPACVSRVPPYLRSSSGATFFIIRRAFSTLRLPLLISGSVPRAVPIHSYNSTAPSHPFVLTFSCLLRFQLRSCRFSHHGPSNT